MRTKVYRTNSRDLLNWANGFFGYPAYDYAGNGGSNGHEGPTAPSTRLPVDVWAEEDTFVLTAYLPGVDTEAVEITMEGDELTIRGEFPQRHEGEAVQYLRTELYHGKFERRINFNVAVDVDGIEATFENGVLRLSVPKAEELRPKQIKVMAK